MCGVVAALLTKPGLSDERVAGALACLAYRGPDHTDGGSPRTGARCSGTCG